MTPGNIVIVGAGQAGAAAARTLRSEGFSGSITLLGAEPHAPYERPPLSKALLEGSAADDSVTLIGAEALQELKVDFHPSTHVCELRIDERRVLCEGGVSVPYDKLILATGGRPTLPPIRGLDEPDVYTLRTLGDARKLRSVLAPGKRLVVIGGGWIGLEVAATARNLGCAVTVVEQAPRLCARSVPLPVSEFLDRLHRTQGVEIVVGEAVREVRRACDGGLNVVLESGMEVATDAVVVGAGLTPNDELARAAGLRCDRGILVDGACTTSAPDIYAAGDVAVLSQSALGGPLRLESWQNAEDQAAAAAKSALGHAIDYRPTGAIWSEQYGTMFQMVGFAPLAVEFVVRQAMQDVSLMVVGVNEKGQAVFAASANAPREYRPLRKWVEQAEVVDLQIFEDLTKSAGQAVGNALRTVAQS